jgi:hypothetical protein
LSFTCRYDLTQVDVVEAVAAEGLATFGGCLPDAAASQLEELLLAALRNGLGYRGKRFKSHAQEPACMVASVMPKIATINYSSQDAPCLLPYYHLPQHAT